MKRILLFVAALAVLSSNVSAGDKKITISHNGNIIEVSKSALNAHLAHGDEIMVLYQGNWITLAAYTAIINSQGGTSGSDIL